MWMVAGGTVHIMVIDKKVLERRKLNRSHTYA